MEPVFKDLDGDGYKEAAVAFVCSAGGVSWPDTVLVYGKAMRLLGHVYLGDLDDPRLLHRHSIDSHRNSMEVGTWER